MALLSAVQELRKFRISVGMNSEFYLGALSIFESLNMSVDAKGSLFNNLKYRFLVVGVILGKSAMQAMLKIPSSGESGSIELTKETYELDRMKSPMAR